jgi:biotin carboxylase
MNNSVVILRWYDAYSQVLASTETKAIVVDKSAPDAHESVTHWITEDPSANPAAAISALLAWQKAGHGCSSVHTSYEDYMASASLMAGALGLGAPSLRRGVLARDKHLQKSLAASEGIRAARARLAQDPCTERPAASTLNWPLVLKPPSAHSSQSVYVAHSLQQYRSVARLYCAEHGHRPGLIEEYIEGTEMHANGYIDSSGVHALTIFEYREPALNMWSGKPNINIYVSQHTSMALYRQVSEMTMQIFRAFGISDSVFHLEFFSTGDGLVFSEVGLRPGGGLTVEAVRYLHGVDLRAAALSLDLGSVVSLVPDHMSRVPERQHLAFLLFMSQEHYGVSLPAAEEWMERPGVIYCKNYPENGRVIKTTHSVSKVSIAASILISADDRPQLLARIDDAKDMYEQLTLQ